MDADDIRQRESGSETNETPDLADDGGDGGTAGTVATTGLDLPVSNRTLLLIGLAVAGAVALWYLSNDSGSGGGGGSDSMADMKDADVGGGAEIEGDDGEDEQTMVVPANPDNPLDADEAVISQLKEAGRIGGGGD